MMINLTPEQKEELRDKIKAARRWGFSKVFIQTDDVGEYETYAVFNLNGRFLRSIHRKKLEEYESGGCPVRMN